MNKLKTVIIYISLVAVGTVIGGYLFSSSQPRSLLALNRCERCLSREDLAGLLASVAIQKTPGLIPCVAFETDRSIAIKLPLRNKRIHYVILPKKDIKNIGEISLEDEPYLMDMFLVARQIIEKERLTKYRLLTNGPGYQDVTYLHIHITD